MSRKSFDPSIDASDEIVLDYTGDEDPMSGLETLTSSNSTLASNLSSVVKNRVRSNTPTASTVPTPTPAPEVKQQQQIKDSDEEDDDDEEDDEVKEMKAKLKAAKKAKAAAKKKKQQEEAELLLKKKQQEQLEKEKAEANARLIQELKVLAEAQAAADAKKKEQEEQEEEDDGQIEMSDAHLVPISPRSALHTTSTTSTSTFPERMVQAISSAHTSPVFTSTLSVNPNLVGLSDLHALNSLPCSPMNHMDTYELQRGSNVSLTKIERTSEEACKEIKEIKQMLNHCFQYFKDSEERHRSIQEGIFKDRKPLKQPISAGEDVAVPVKEKKPRKRKNSKQPEEGEKPTVTTNGTTTTTTKKANKKAKVEEKEKESISV